MIPRDQVDLARATRRAEVSRHNHVTEFAQVKVSGDFTARASALVRWTLIRSEETLCRLVQTFNDDSSKTGGNHDYCWQTKEGME